MVSTEASQIALVREQLTSKVTQLVTSSSTEASQLLVQDLAALVQYGVTETHIHTLFNIILDTSTTYNVSNPQKRHLVKNVLVPDRSYELPSSILYQIVSSVGYPQVYFENGQKKKSKKIPATLQTALLDWLISSIHLFGESVFNILQELVPILFSLLSFEFSRLQIVNLLFLTLLNGQNSASQQPVVKKWHIKRTIDLYNKFPMDESLKSLLILFKYLVPTLDYSKYDSLHSLEHLGVFSSKLKYPNMNYLRKLNDLKAHQEGNAVIAKSDTMVDTILGQYAQFNRLKRRKVQSSNEIDNLDIIQFNSSRLKSIHDIHSLPMLVASLDNVRFLNVTSIFTKPFVNKSEVNYLVVKHLLNSTDVAFKKIDLFLRINFNEEFALFNEFQLICDNLVKVLEIQPQLIHLPALVDFINFKIATPFNQFRVLEMRLRFLKYYPLNVSDFHLCFKHISKLLATESSDKAISLFIEKGFNQLFVGLYDMFHAWHSVSTESLSSISSILVELYPLVAQKFHNFTILMKLNFLKLLRFVCGLKPSQFNSHFTSEAALLPSTIVYGLLFTVNPLVISELCRFVAYTRNFRFDETHKTTHNGYIMDILNFLWRDKAFYYEEDTSNRGMQFHPNFLSKLPVLNVFGYSSLSKINTIGNLFHNPAWSYITTHLIWDMENDEPNIARRHPGPVTEESVAAIASDTTHKWLDLTFNDLKVHILQQLDQLGYTGLGDLLFNSLRSLANARKTS